jgi:hypothetical protein
VTVSGGAASQACCASCGGRDRLSTAPSARPMTPCSIASAARSGRRALPAADDGCMSARRPFPRVVTTP